MVEVIEPKRASRRDVLRYGALATASVLVPAVSAFASAPGRLFRVPPDSENEPVALLYRSTFQSQLHQSFGVRQPVGRPWMRTVTLRLVDVKDVPTAQAGGTEGREDCFTAVFSGPVRAPLAQRTYAVTNGSLGRFQLFLVPGGVSGSERLYTATFNRAFPS